jgi:hypothetical protein
MGFNNNNHIHDDHEDRQHLVSGSSGSSGISRGEREVASAGRGGGEMGGSTPTTLSLSDRDSEEWEIVSDRTMKKNRDDDLLSLLFNPSKNLNRRRQYETVSTPIMGTNVVSSGGTNLAPEAAGIASTRSIPILLLLPTMTGGLEVTNSSTSPASSAAPTNQHDHKLVQVHTHSHSALPLPVSEAAPVPVSISELLVVPGLLHRHPHQDNLEAETKAENNRITLKEDEKEEAGSIIDMRGSTSSAVERINEEDNSSVTTENTYVTKSQSLLSQPQADETETETEQQRVQRQTFSPGVYRHSSKHHPRRHRQLHTPRPTLFNSAADANDNNKMEKDSAGGTGGTVNSSWTSGSGVTGSSSNGSGNIHSKNDSKAAAAGIAGIAAPFLTLGTNNGLPSLAPQQAPMIKATTYVGATGMKIHIIDFPPTPGTTGTGGGTSSNATSTNTTTDNKKPGFMFPIPANASGFKMLQLNPDVIRSIGDGSLSESFHNLQDSFGGGIATGLGSARCHFELHMQAQELDALAVMRGTTSTNAAGELESSSNFVAKVSERLHYFSGIRS